MASLLLSNDHISSHVPVCFSVIIAFSVPFFGVYPNCSSLVCVSSLGLPSHNFMVCDINFIAL